MPFLKLSDGRRLAYRDTERHGPALVLVHGAGQSSVGWLRVLPLLARKARVFALDLPGHGRSDGPAAERVEALREAVRDFVSGLRLERPILVGHSLGGAIALDYALAYAGELSGLGLVSTMASFVGQQPVLDVLARQPGGFHRFFAGRAFAASVAPGDALAHTEELLAAPPEVLRADFVACEHWNVRHRLGEVRVPAVVVTGDDDRVSPAKEGRALAAALGTVAGPGGGATVGNARFVELAGAGHMLPVEQPAALAAVLETLLERAR